MRTVLIGIGAAIVLAAAVFAIVHFWSGGKPAFTPQNGWVPVVSASSPEHGPVHTVGNFGAWRVVCRNFGPNEKPARAPIVRNLMSNLAAPVNQGHCAVTLVMRYLDAPKTWLNLRFPAPAAGSPAVAALAFAKQRKFLAHPGTAPEPVDLKADKDTVSLLIQQCFNGVCLAIGQLSQSDIDSISSANTLEIRLAPTQPAKGDVVNLPTDGLKAAFAALKRQPA